VVEDIITKAQHKMEKAVAAVSHEFSGLRTGRASAVLLEKLLVDYYGTKTPLQQIASFSVPEPQLLIIQPWDKTVISAIEKAILQSDLGLTPANDGNVIRIAFPPLSEERRKELVKVAKKMAEDGRVAVRNVRREANEHLKELEKKHEISEDDLKRAQQKIDDLTKKFIEEIDKLLNHKEKEILEV